MLLELDASWVIVKVGTFIRHCIYFAVSCSGWISVSAPITAFRYCMNFNLRCSKLRWVVVDKSATQLQRNADEVEYEWSFLKALIKEDTGPVKMIRRVQLKLLMYIMITFMIHYLQKAVEFRKWPMCLILKKCLHNGSPTTSGDWWFCRLTKKGLCSSS